LTPTANHAKHHDGKADNRVRPSRHAHRQAKNVDQNGNSEFTAPNADHPAAAPITMPAKKPRVPSRATVMLGTYSESFMAADFSDSATGGPLALASSLEVGGRNYRRAIVD